MWEKNEEEEKVCQKEMKNSHIAAQRMKPVQSYLSAYVNKIRGF